MSTGNVESQLSRKLPLDRISEICGTNDVVQLSVFGSFLRDDFGPESDIDFMVIFRKDDYAPWMSKLQQLESQLSQLLGRDVDVVTKESVLRSENWIRRNHILENAQVIYE